MNLNIGKTTEGKAFSLPAELVTYTQAIIATKGKGKTYLAMVQTEEMLKAGLPVVCLDPTGVWWGLQADGTGKGFPIIVFGGEHGNVPLEPDSGQIVADFIVDTNRSAVLDMSGFESNAAQDRFATAFAERFYRRKSTSRTPIHLMVDESDSFCPQRPMPGQQRMLGAFEAIVRRGRSRGIGITLITQRPAVLNKNVLMMAELLTCLGIVGHLDQKAVGEWVKVHDDGGKQSVFMASLAGMPKGRAWFWSPSWLDCFVQVNVRAKTTFDSSKTPEAGQKWEAPKNVAAPDLEALTAQIKATIDKAKADDPRELKRKIVELQKQVAAKSAVKPCDHEKEISELNRKLQSFASLLNQIQDCKNSVGLAVDGIRSALDSISGTVGQLSPGYNPFLNHLTFRVPQPNLSKNRPESKQVPKVVKKVERVNDKALAGLNLSQRRILVALSQRAQMGFTSTNARIVATLVGLKMSGGTFGEYLSRLRTAGLIEGQRDNMRITESGETVIEDYPRLPVGRELLDWYKANRLNARQSQMLDIILDHPKGISKTELAELAGVVVTGGTFGEYLSRMRSLGLIEGSVEIRLSQLIADQLG